MPRGVPLKTLVPVLIALLAVIAYGNTLPSGFVYDDNAIVASNPLVKTLDNLPRIVSTGYWGPENRDSGLYRPVTVASYAVDHAIWGLDPRPFHAVNVLLHAAVSVLAWILLRALPGCAGIAAPAAIVFAIHPAHAEAVSGIVGRAEILSAGFTLAALLFHLRYAGTRRPAMLAGSSLAFFFALLSKETAIVFPALAAALDFSDRAARRAGAPGVPRRAWGAYAGTLILVLAARTLVLGPQQAAGPAAVSLMDNPLYDLPAAQRTASALYVLGRYLGLLVLPARLSADYSYAQIPPIGSLFDPRLVVAAAVAGGGAWLVFHAFGRRPALLTAAALVFLPLLPVSNLVVPIGTIMAERVLYLPVLGIGVIFGLGFARLRGAAPAAAWILAGLLVAAGTGRTMARNLDWRDDATLFASALEVVPRSSRMHLFMGRHLNWEGRHEEAVGHLEESLAILPANPDALGEMGYARLAAGEFEAAERNFRAAIRIDPDHVGGRLGLAGLYRQIGRYEEALVELWQCVDLAPLHLDARVQIGIVRRTLRDPAGAREVLESVLALDPTSLAATYHLGLVERELGDARGALRRFESAVAAARPWSLDDHVYLGLLYGELGMPEKARGYFAAAVELAPRSAFARGHLAAHELARGAHRRALREAELALERNPFAIEAMQIAAEAQASLGRAAGAESLLVRARALRPRDAVTALRLAEIRLARGDWDGAEQELRRAWTFDPGSGAVLAARARLAAGRGDLAGARALLAEARAVHPDRTAIDLERIRLDLAAGDTAAAFHALDRLPSRGEVSGRHQNTIGRLHEALGRWDDADRAYRLARIAEPEHADHLYRHAELLIRRERFDEADATLARLLDLHPDHADGWNARAWLALRRGPDGAPLEHDAQALAWADSAIALDGLVAAFHDTRAEALERLGRRAEARLARREAARLEPADPRYAARAADAPDPATRAEERP